MSRVRKPNKFMNSNKYESPVTGPSKVIRSHTGNGDYHQATTLSSWLSLKYGMSYKTFRNKSRARRDEIQEEYQSDTRGAREEQVEEQMTWEDAQILLAECGVPFDTDGEPVGIWSDD